ncbi:peritrophin-1-like [Artemia franciscana]|uniref:peritrophin-1-like n=1 Tax=Artemia franciscana TaxID=6661 RepID=UPI0032DA433B
MNQVFILCVTLATIVHGKDLRKTNLCPEVDSVTGWSVYFSYPGDCSKFIQCSNGFAIVHTCPGDLVFDNTLNVCNYRQNVEGECGNNPEEPTTTEKQVEITTEVPVVTTTEAETTEMPTTEAQTTEAETEAETTAMPTTEAQTEGPITEKPVGSECPEVDGPYAFHLPHESDCTMFYKCDRGTPVLQLCPHDLWYNAALQVCDRPELSGCTM